MKEFLVVVWQYGTTNYFTRALGSSRRRQASTLIANGYSL